MALKMEQNGNETGRYTQYDKPKKNHESKFNIIRSYHPTNVTMYNYSIASC